MLEAPAAFEAGGEHRMVIDTTVVYLNPTNVADAVHGPPEKPMADAEQDKRAKLRAGEAAGIRSPLPPGFTFTPMG